MSNGPQFSSSLWLKPQQQQKPKPDDWVEAWVPFLPKGSLTYQIWRHPETCHVYHSFLSWDFTRESRWDDQSGNKEKAKTTSGNLWGWEGDKEQLDLMERECWWANSSHTTWGPWTPTSPSYLGKGDGLWGTLSTGNTAGFQGSKLEKKELHMAFRVDIGLDTSFSPSPCGVKRSF